MTMFLENPMPVIFVGILLEAALATIFVSSRNRSILLAMAAVLVLVFAGVALERWVVTDVERVEAALDGTAAALEANDLNQILTQCVSPRATRTQAHARQALGLVEITSTKMNNLSITINPLTSPPTATAEFRGVFHFEPKTAYITQRFYTSDFVVELRLESDRWLITDHIEQHEIR
jgi:hypothetical protein